MGRFSRNRLAVGIILAVVLIHLASIGQSLPVQLARLYASYASDVLIPFAAWQILVLAEARNPPFRSPALKGALVFGVAAAAETLQGLGIEALGRTFDPLDYCMYALGALLAFLLERLLFPEPRVPPRGR